MKISEGKVITLEYELRNENGELIESSKDDGLYEYIYGTGEMLQGVEKAIEGLQKGDTIEIIVPPEEGFGIRNEELIEEINIDEFPEGSEIEEGMEFDVEDEDGEAIITILKRNGDTVTVDANHPLAGKVLKVSATIVDVREADPAELEHHHHHHHDHQHNHDDCDHDSCSDDNCTCSH